MKTARWLGVSIALVAACSASPSVNDDAKQDQPMMNGDDPVDPVDPVDPGTTGDPLAPACCSGSKLFFGTKVGYHETSVEDAKQDACSAAVKDASTQCEHSTWICEATPKSVIGARTILYCNYAGTPGTAGSGWYCKCRDAVSCEYSWTAFGKSEGPSADDPALSSLGKEPGCTSDGGTGGGGGYGGGGSGGTGGGGLGGAPACTPCMTGGCYVDHCGFNPVVCMGSCQPGFKCVSGSCYPETIYF